MPENSSLRSLPSRLNSHHLLSPIIYTGHDKNLIEDTKQLLLNNCFLSLCTVEQQDLIMKNIKISRYYRQQMMFKHGQVCDELFIVLQGVIKLSWNLVDGKCITHYFLPAGLMINIVPLVLGRPLMHDCSAHETTVIASIPRHAFLSVLQQNPAFSQKIFELVCQRYYTMFEDTYHQINHSLRTRLVYKLLFLIDYFSQPSKNTMQINIKLSQEHFAELLQTSRQSINKEFRWLAQQGIIEVKYNQLVILDLDKLKSLSH